MSMLYSQAEYQLYSQQKLKTKHQLVAVWYMSGSKASPLEEDTTIVNNIPVLQD